VSDGFDLFDLDGLHEMSDQDILELVEKLPPALVGSILSEVRKVEDKTLPELEMKLLDHQQIPDWEDDWEGFALVGGRGVGKTATTSYIACMIVRHYQPDARMRIVVPTFGDAVAANVRGPSGIMAMDPTVTWHPSEPGGAVLRWPTGAECALIGTPTLREVDRLRAQGNVHYDFFEEAAANPMIDEAFTQAQLGRRLGSNPRWFASTTPRPLQILRDWMDDPSVIVRRATTHDNPYLPDSYLRALKRRYEGTRLWRQEVEGEIIDDIEGALWSWLMLDRSRIQRADMPELAHVAVGVDPAKSTGTTGIVVVGLGIDGHLYVLEDLSRPAARAEEWATTAAAAADKWGAKIVAEDDSGGDAIRVVLQTMGYDVSVAKMSGRAVKRERGLNAKQSRAVPVAIEWERDPATAHIVGSLPRLEDEMTMYDGTRASKVDRLDACTWACRWLRGSFASKGSIQLQPAVPARPSVVRSGRSLTALRQGNLGRNSPALHRSRPRS
jgi:phage terminase large subunit-like protein